MLRLKEFFSIFIFTLCFSVAFVSPHLYAADLKIDVLTVNGEPYSGGPLDPRATSIIIQISLVNWNFGTDVIFGVSQKVSLSSGSAPQGLVTLNGAATVFNAAAGFDPGFCFVLEAVANEQYEVTNGAINCAGNADPTWLVQLELVPTGAQGTLTVTAETDIDTAPPYDFYVARLPSNCPNQVPTDDIAGQDGTATITLSSAALTTTTVPADTTSTSTTVPDNGGGGGGGGGGGSPTTTSSQPEQSSTTTSSTAPSTTTSIENAPSTSTSTSVAPPPPGPCAAEELYGADSEEVAQLQALRDEVLSKSATGQKLIKLYYTWSPVLAKAIREHQHYKADLRVIADKMIGLIKNIF
jgi:hypothetical protein